MKNITCSHSEPWRLALPETDRDESELYEVAFALVKQPYVVINTKGWGTVFDNGTATDTLDFFPVYERRVKHMRRVVPQPYGLLDVHILTSRKDARIVDGFDWFNVFQLNAFVFVAFLVVCYCLIRRKFTKNLNLNFIITSMLFSFLIVNWMFGAILLNFQINKLVPSISELKEIPDALQRGMIRLQETKFYTFEEGFATFMRLKADHRIEYEAIEQNKPELADSMLELLQRVAFEGNRFFLADIFYIIQDCASHPGVCGQLASVPLFKPNLGYFVSFVSDEFPKMCYERLRLSMILLDQYGHGEHLLVPYIEKFKREQRETVWKIRKISFQDISFMFYVFLTSSATAILLFIAEQYHRNLILSTRHHGFVWALRQTITDTVSYPYLTTYS